MPKRDDAYMRQKRSEILDAAVDCLVRRGISGFSTTQICEEAGISMGALYTHFESKNEILCGLIERANEERAALHLIKTFAEFRELILDVARGLNTLQTIQKIRVDLELMSASHTDSKLGALMESVLANKDIEKLLAKLQKAGEIDEDTDVKSAAAAIAAQILGFSVFAASGGYYVKSRVAAMEMLLDSIAR